MKCRQIKPLLADYADGCLDKNQKVTVSQHIRDCQSCRLESEQLEKIQLLLKADRIPAPDEGFWPELNWKIMQQTEKAEIPWRETIFESLRQRSFAYSLGLGLSAALIAMLYFAFPEHSSKLKTNGEPVYRYTHPGTNEELINQLSGSELEEVAQSINIQGEGEEVSIVGQADPDELLSRLDGRQLEYLDNQIKNITYGKMEERHET
ncbi:MAG: zf-HC2 domain-containing protein [Candidatus Schekmanbacteria bacterium]|nr:zf-HC2 domain-containing protein [Candidatus Schekmanbacteria bacterium]